MNSKSTLSGVQPTQASQPLTIGEKVIDVLSGRKLRHSAPDTFRFYCGWLGSIFAVITIVVLALQGSPTEANSKTLSAVALPLLVVWTIVPPMYFWFDYYVLWHIESQNKTTQFATLDEFKHGQELSRNLWLAIVALLAGLYFK